MELQAAPSQVLEEAASGLSGYSLEVTAGGVDQAQAAVRALRPGTAFSITFLPGEDYPARLRAAQVLRSLGFVPVPHLSARRMAGVREAESFIEALAVSAAVDRVFVVGGDPDRPLGPFRDALDLIETGLLERHGIREVGIGGYPEGHPAIPSDRLWAALQAKCEAIEARGMRPFIVTQFGFEPGVIVEWLTEVRRRGIRCPVRVGVAGPAKIATLMRYAARCGVSASARAMSRYGLSLTRMIRSAGPGGLIADLAAGLHAAGIRDVGLHYYTFGGFQQTIDWIRSFHEAQHG
ncbi:methylenetetrahydrofolate reductase [Castellaniella defragrans]|uniref:methylenetetrahydrofolate reductase n=1 Tax=Castellaniella defragrans TaxID=75697 RepID=UPI002AFDCFEB|nr:methylenetetrahydrofolate reductase [Castellaniella defragrans]